MILTIDTTNKNIRVLLQNKGKLVDHLLLEQSTRQAERLVLEIEEILKRNNLWYGDMDAYSLVNGVGSFTGLKISTAVIKAIKSIFCDTPVIVNNTFEIISFNQEQNKEYDFIILEADINGCYVKNSDDKMEYMKNNKISLLFDNRFLQCEKVITNRKNLDSMCHMDSTIEIDYREINNENIVLLNDFKYKNKIFSDDIYPLYLREPQIIKKQKN